MRQPRLHLPRVHIERCELLGPAIGHRVDWSGGKASPAGARAAQSRNFRPRKKTKRCAPPSAVRIFVAVACGCALWVSASHSRCQEHLHLNCATLPGQLEKCRHFACDNAPACVEERWNALRLNPQPRPVATAPRPPCSECAPKASPKRRKFRAACLAPQLLG